MTDKDGDDVPLVMKKELRSWYVWEIASTGWENVAMASMLPLLLQAMAYENAGYPGSCPNYVAEDYNLTQSLFQKDIQTYFFDNTTSVSACSDCVPYGNLTYCEGPPPTPLWCFESDGSTQHRVYVMFGNYEMDPTQYVFFFISFSVILQVIAFISLAGLADYGTFRKRLFVSVSVTASITCMLSITVTPETWWLGGVFMVITNVLYGVAVVCYDSWIPELARGSLHPDSDIKWKTVDDNTDKERNHFRVIDSISTTGILYATGTHFGVLFLAAPFFVFGEALTGSPYGGYRIAIMITGLLWFSVQFYTFRHLKSPVCPPLPENMKSYVGFSWYRAYKTMRTCRELPELFKFLAAWFIYSDAMTTLGGTAVLALSVLVQWCYLDMTIGLLMMLVFTPIAGLTGLGIQMKMQSKFGYSAKSLLIANRIIMTLIPAYGFFGFDPSLGFGLVYGFEMIIAAVVFGATLAPSLAYSRSIFSSMLPRGFESQYFGFYEITNKGSSWIGPLIVGLLQASTGDLRYGFFYLVFASAAPIALLAWLDVQKGVEQAEAYSKKHRKGKDDDADAFTGFATD